MFNNILKKLKTIFNDGWNGPYYPAPEVKKALEDKGYKFEHLTIAGPGYAVDAYDITTAEGKLLNRKDGTLQAYLETYEQTVEEFKTRSNAPAPSHDNKPEPK